jgi:hypothetical protein
MRSLAPAAVALAFVCSAGAARADQTPVPPSLELGARLGFGLPLGSTSSGADFNTFISNMVPIWLDAGVAIHDNWYVGGYFQYGFGSMPGMFASACRASGLSCKVFDGRIGGNVQFRAHTGRDQVWVGLGTGYEWYGIDFSAGGQTASLHLGGWEFVNVQAGYDYLAKPTVGVGPFVALTVAQFKDASTSGTGMDVSQSIPSQALHEWLVFGVRGIVDLTFTRSKPRPPEPVDTRPPEVTDPDAEDRKPRETEQPSTSEPVP